MDGEPGLVRKENAFLDTFWTPPKTGFLGGPKMGFFGVLGGFFGVFGILTKNPEKPPKTPQKWPKRPFLGPPPFGHFLGPFWTQKMPRKIPPKNPVFWGPKTHFWTPDFLIFQKIGGSQYDSPTPDRCRCPPRVRKYKSLICVLVKSLWVGWV